MSTLESELPHNGPATHLLDSLRRMASTLIDLLHTRIELATTEIEEEGARMAGLVLLAAIGFYCLTIGLIFAGMFLIIALWENYRLWAAGGLTLFFVGTGTIIWLVFRQRLRTRPRFLSATVAELGKDRDLLRPSS